MRQMQSPPLVRHAAPVLGLGVLLGFAAPFAGDPPLDAPARYLFWISMAFAGFAAALAAEKLVPQAFTRRTGVRLAVVAIASALPLTFVAAWAISLVRPGHFYQPLQLPGLFAAVATVQLAITIVLLGKSTVRPRPDPAPTRAGTGTGSFPTTLLSRLPKRLGEDVVALQSEDHYLRVHTTLGSDLILMRLSDAIAAMEPSLGLQVHRSWWVAESAVCEIIRSEQRTHVKLTNGLLVPVGRSYSAVVRSWVRGSVR